MVVDGVLEWLWGAAAGKFLSFHFLLLTALAFHTFWVAWQDGGEGGVEKGVGGRGETGWQEAALRFPVTHS